MKEHAQISEPFDELCANVMYLHSSAWVWHEWNKFLLVFSHIMPRTFISSPTYMQIMHCTGLLSIALFHFKRNSPSLSRLSILILRKIRSIRVMDVVRQVRRHSWRRRATPTPTMEHLPEMLLSLPTKVDAALPCPLSASPMDGTHSSLGSGISVLSLENFVFTKGLRPYLPQAKNTQ